MIFVYNGRQMFLKHQKLYFDKSTPKSFVFTMMSLVFWDYGLSINGELGNKGTLKFL